MDWGILKKTDFRFLKKYRYVILIFAVGVFLMCLPLGNTEKTPSPEPIVTVQPVADTQSALEEILAEIAGAGKVKVLLTIGEGEQVIYQTDESSSHGSDSTMLKIETVITTDTKRAQNGLIRQVNPPVYLGAVVVCQGADSAAVRLAVTEAVMAATGLTTDKITVLKMK